MRFSKLDAAARLGVSPSTVDRMIQRGELEAEKEHHGTRYKIWVIFDDKSADESLDESLDEAVRNTDESPDSPEPRVDEAAPRELAGLRERVKYAEERARNLEGLADYHKQLLADSEWRFQEILQQLKQSQDNVALLTRALPAPQKSRSLRNRFLRNHGDADAGGRSGKAEPPSTLYGCRHTKSRQNKRLGAFTQYKSAAITLQRAATRGWSRKITKSCAGIRESLTLPPDTPPASRLPFSTGQPNPALYNFAT